MSDPLELETRRRIVAGVRRFPGLHARELARQLGMSQALLEYHLPILLAAKALREERLGNQQRLFGADEPLSPADSAALARLRDPNGLPITLYLLEDGPTRHGDLARALGLGKSRLSFHLRKLEQAGVVAGQDGGFGISDPARIERLLLRHEPTPDLRDRFADLWDSFYG